MIMSSSKIKWTSKKIIAMILLGLSFIMFFVPWMSISLNVMGQKFTIPKVLDYVAMYNSFSPAQFKTELYDELVEISEEMTWEGIHMDPKQAMTTIDLISDSTITPIDAARISTFANSLLTEIKSYLSRNSQDFYGEERILASMVTDVAGEVAFAAVFMWVLVIANVLAFSISIYLVFKDKKYGAVPYICVSFVMLIVFAVLSSKVNGGIKQLISMFSYGAASFFSNLGINYSSSMDLSVFHLSAAGFFSVIFAVGALVLSIIENGKSITIPPFAVEKKWTCLSCGNAMAARPAYCPFCGTPSGEKHSSPTKQCPSCKRSVSSESSTCPFCGYNFAGSSGPRLRGTLVKPSDDDLG